MSSMNLIRATPEAGHVCKVIRFPVERIEESAKAKRDKTIAKMAAVFEGSEFTRTDTGAKGRTTKAEAFREAEQMLSVLERIISEGGDRG